MLNISYVKVNKKNNSKLNPPPPPLLKKAAIVGYIYCIIVYTIKAMV